MTFTVLAVDGLDIQRAGEYPWLSRELEDNKALLYGEVFWGTLDQGVLRCRTWRGWYEVDC